MIYDCFCIQESSNWQKNQRFAIFMSCAKGKLLPLTPWVNFQILFSTRLKRTAGNTFIKLVETGCTLYARADSTTLNCAIAVCVSGIIIFFDLYLLLLSINACQSKVSRLWVNKVLNYLSLKLELNFKVVLYFVT